MALSTFLYSLLLVCHRVMDYLVLVRCYSLGTTPLKAQGSLAARSLDFDHGCFRGVLRVLRWESGLAVGGTRLAFCVLGGNCEMVGI